MAKDSHRTPELLPPAAAIRHTGTARGRGVFATRAFAEGETVELCPVLVLHQDFALLPAEIKTYVFDWSVLAGVEGTQAVALGFGSMYNHANPANLRYEARREEELLHFVAVRAIAAGEELTVNYNGHAGTPQWHDDNWFERMNVKPLAD